MSTQTTDEIIDALLARFERAAQHVGSRDVDLVVAGHAVRLRFAGDGSVDSVLPALAHLVAPAHARVDLTVHVWDTQTTSVDVIPAPWDMTQLAVGGTIPQAIAQGLYATYDIARERLVVLDPGRGLAFVWIRDPSQVARHERAAPLRGLFAAYFGARGLVITHAGAVARGGRGVLLGGRGGSGKSSTALACLAAGFDYAGDDYVLTEPDAAGGPRVHSLYATGKVFPADTGRLAEIQPAFAGRDGPGLAPDDKAIAYLHGSVPERMSRGFALVALLMPTVTGLPHTRVVPMSSAHALRALAPSTIVQYDGAPAPLFAALARLVARLPCHRLELGTERHAIPGVVARVIETGA